jgi:hypothetical protein
MEDVMTTTAAPLPAPHRHRSAFSIGVAVVALVGVPAIWLPFGYGISPASALFDNGFFHLWPLAWPHLLAIPIAAALLRWAASGRLSKAERCCGRLLAAGACCVTGSLFVEPFFDGNWPASAGDWTAFLVPLAMLAGVVALAVRVPHGGRAADGLDAIVMMEMAYLPNVALCVQAATGGGEHLQVGGYAVLLTSGVYLVQILALQLIWPAPRSL